MLRLLPRQQQRRAGTIGGVHAATARLLLGARFLLLEGMLGACVPHCS